MWFVVLGAALGIGLWAYRSWPGGADPFHDLPAGIGAKTGSNDVKSPSSGRMYTVTSYAPTGTPERTFHVAVQKSLPNWVRYYQDRASGARAFEKGYAGASTDNASDDQILAGLRKDFNAT